MLASGRAGNAAGPLDAAAAVLRGAGPVEVAPCSSHADLDAALARLGDRAPVVAGGDGSLHLAVNRLARQGRLGAAPVGLLPLGTGNDFARGAGVPLDPVAAATAIAEGGPRPCDLIAGDRGTVVVNAVHAGVGAEAAASAAGFKRALGPAAYPLGALLAGAREPGWSLRVTVDGREVAGEPLLMVAVANGPTIGGGTPLCPGAAVDDGLLDVVVVAATGPAARVGFAAALRAGTHLGRDDVRHHRGRSARIAGDALRYNADGEVSGPLPERGYRLLPGAWSLLGPPR